MLHAVSWQISDRHYSNAVYVNDVLLGEQCYNTSRCRKIQRHSILRNTIVTAVTFILSAADFVDHIQGD